jgi:uncharacterized membrane protein YqjE
MIRNLLPGASLDSDQPVSWPDTVMCGLLVLGFVGCIWALAKYTNFFN